MNKYSVFASLIAVVVLNGLTLNPLLAQQAYQPLSVTGFNEDLIANGSGDVHQALSTTRPRGLITMSP